jgi:serine/threonine protein kinase
MTTPNPEPRPDNAVSESQAAPATDKIGSAFDTILGHYSTPAAVPASVGEYRVLGELGRGGMGVVYRAEDPHLRREVAIKLMLPQLAANPEVKARFVREARAQARVEHEHVAAIYHVSEDAGLPYLVMPLLKGMTLQAALNANPRPPLAEVIRIAREVAEGLAAAHEQGLVHRDIKPSNVWLEGKRLRVKILDFGLARVATDAEADASGPVTREGMMVGTPTHMSPEQARGQVVDGRTDLFSLGVVLYQMTTGELPFRGATPFVLLTSVAYDHPAPPAEKNPAVPLVLSDLVMRLLSKDPAGRPPTAEAVAEELRAIEVGLASAVRVIPLDSVPPTPVVPAGPDPFTDLDATDPGTPVTGSPREPVASPKSRAASWVAAGLLVLAGLTFGVWQAIKPAAKKNPDDVAGKAEPSVKPPAKAEEKEKPPARTTTERRAAEWVVRNGGAVELAAGDKPLGSFRSADRLPAEPFRVVSVEFAGAPGLDDRAVENLRDTTTLTRLSLAGTGVGDRGLSHLTANTNLVNLNLGQSKVTDAGLDHVARFPKLVSLTLHDLPVSDAGLAKLKALPDLTYLDIRRTPVTDAGLAHLAGMKLAGVNAEQVPVTDKGLEHLASATTLTHLNVAKTRVTGPGVKKLAAALPRCTIFWDGGTIKPREVSGGKGTGPTKKP